MKTRIGNRVYGDHTYIMGILNVTPDSFSDGGRYTGLDAALYHAEQMLREGADILDVGGESTRPGYTRISDEEEISRITPVIEAIRARLDIPVSADTYKPAVAAAALQAGADMINDIWGFQAEPGMAEVVAQAGAACCLMHNRKEPVYDSFFEDVLSDLPEHRPCKSRRNPGRPDPAGRRRGLCQKPGAESGDHPAGQRDRCAGVSGAVGHLPEIRDRTDAGCSGGSAAGGNPCYNSGGGYDRLPVCPGA